MFGNLLIYSRNDGEISPLSRCPVVPVVPLDRWTVVTVVIVGPFMSCALLNSAGS
jgi:hypothetical protein